LKDILVIKQNPDTLGKFSPDQVVQPALLVEVKQPINNIVEPLLFIALIKVRQLFGMAARIENQI